ncbi:MAG: hypothetical protein ACSHW1_16940 [Yoonia sp.]|uniref:hypothetical protein n=1 Tax=Yoonia sp. TaxID=2212373 RepID=UPI003EF7DF4C
MNTKCLINNTFRKFSGFGLKILELRVPSLPETRGYVSIVATANVKIEELIANLPMLWRKSCSLMQQCPLRWGFGIDSLFLTHGNAS